MVLIATRVKIVAIGSNPSTPEFNNFDYRRKLPSGEWRGVAKTNRCAPLIPTLFGPFVEKIHRLRLHIVRPDVELLSLPNKQGAWSKEHGV
jgi:hypothetical protein